MKIGLIVPGFSADENDWCIPAHRNLARSLASTNQVHVFALRYPHRRDDYTVNSVKVHSLNGQKRQGLGSAHLWTNALRAIQREHQVSRFHILHSIYGGEAGFVTVLASRLLNVRSVVSLVGGELAGLKDIDYGQDLQWRQHLMNQIALRFADRVLCGSLQMTELARRRMPKADAVRIQTLPLGVDTKMFSPPADPLSESHLGQNAHESASAADQDEENTFHIMNVGSLIPVKDQSTLLHAAAEFMRECPNVRVRIIGTGSLEQHLRDLASNLQITHRVDFAGAVAHDRLPTWYRRADLFVQSSRHEGEGMAVLEAAATGIPIVGTDVGVLSALAGQGAAIAVPTGDAKALAGAMRRALSSPGKLGAWAREIAQSEYNLEGIGERLLEVYHSIQNQEC